MTLGEHGSVSMTDAHRLFATILAQPRSPRKLKPEMEVVKAERV